MLPDWVPDTIAVRETLFKGAMPDAGLAVRFTDRVGRALTVRVNVVVWVTPPVPVTVIIYDPVGVDADVAMVMVLVQVGVQDVGE